MYARERGDAYSKAKNHLSTIRLANSAIASQVPNKS